MILAKLLAERVLLPLAVLLGTASAEPAWALNNLNRGAHCVTGDVLASVARQQVLDYFTQHGIRAELNVSQTPADLAVGCRAEDAVDIRTRELQLSPNSGETHAHHSIWLDVFINDRLERSVPVIVEVTQLGSQQHADRVTARTTDDVQSEPTALVQKSGSRVQRGKGVQGIHSVQLASALQAQPSAPQSGSSPMLRTEPLFVHKGEQLTLRTVDGGIELESRIEVLQDGLSGQLVRVRLSTAASPVMARVVALGKVEVVQ